MQSIYLKGPDQKLIEASRHLLNEARGLNAPRGSEDAE